MRQTSLMGSFIKKRAPEHSEQTSNDKRSQQVKNTALQLKGQINNGTQQFGKQKEYPKGIFYTPIMKLDSSTIYNPNKNKQSHSIPNPTQNLKVHPQNIAKQQLSSPFTSLQATKYCPQKIQILKPLPFQQLSSHNNNKIPLVRASNQPTFQVKDDGKSYQKLMRLKKHTTMDNPNNKTPGSAKKATNKNNVTGKKRSLNKKISEEEQNDDNQDYEINSESYEQEDQQDESSQDDAFDQDDDQDQKKGKNNKRRQNKNRTTNKNIKKFEQKKINQQQKKPIDQDYQEQEHSEETLLFDRTRFADGTPDWAIPGHPNCRDKQGLTCTDPNYDETTLLVRDYIWNQASAPMKQYWRIKSQNFDKLIFFKLGKFYELFYEDALLANQLLQLKWMGNKMHVGFPQKSLDRYTRQLVKHGVKVVVVEQMQTPQQMNNRLKVDKQHGRKSQKTLNRQITQIITKGTILTQDDQTYLPNYLLVIYRYEQQIAYSLLELSTNHILMGIINGFEQFKTILYQTRPSELLYDPDNFPKEWIQIMKENIQGMVITKLMNKQNLWHYLNATNELAQLEERRVIKQKPRILKEIQGLNVIVKNLLMSTLSGLFEYLHKIYKFQYVLSTVKFKFYEKEKALTHMVLDSQALQHLQVFQTPIGQEGSLFSKIDKTKSRFGKRLFRRWMTSPLLNILQITNRLDAISDLIELNNQVPKIHSVFSKLADLQKLANRLYKYSVTNTSAASAVYFEDLHTQRLKEFDNFMKSMEDSFLVFKMLEEHEGSFRSRRLKRLIKMSRRDEGNVKEEKLIFFQDEECEIGQEQEQLQEQDGLLPDIISHLHSFKQYISWKQGKPYPKPGVIELYDALNTKQRQIKSQLASLLQQIRIQLKCPSISYAHIKQRYEVQIPQNKKIKIPQSFTFSSRKAGYSRYLVPAVQEVVEELQSNEKKVKEQMGIFITFFFQQFKQKQNVWERYINVLAEVDCLMAMTVYARSTRTCKPKFVDKGYEVTQAVHPALGNSDFVANDISFKHPIIILTGPNMGGKSTILRTSCLLAIMAQMGCYVPCKSYSASLIDRIFTRIGASDKLQYGKSTFFIQMQQTKSVVTHATSRSLAIIDELGRGTATFDGMALAHSVLNFLIQKINCKCMFATHYHSLTQQFASMPGTCLKMMDYEIIKEQEDRIDFLYKLVDGKAEKSFGLNVAQLVGLPKKLISAARVKSDQMHKQIEQKKQKVKVMDVMEQIISCKN